ncbi:MAG: hypothetical protein JWP12_1084 [Bacteroidetes bacterium]|nr:hypothetical protein [Bacteroidota bacterium]
MQEKFKILSSKGFVIALALLLLNDFIFKTTFHNWFTGKLSDVAGLFIFPIFWTAFFPKQKKTIYFFTALIFIFWKSPFSQFLINDWNALNLLSIYRVIDYSDLIALLILPFSFQHSAPENRKTTFAIHPIFLILIAAFSFVATSKYDRNTLPAWDYYSFKDAPLKYGKEIAVQKKQYTFEISSTQLAHLINTYHLSYSERLKNDSSFLFAALPSSYDSVSPVIKASIIQSPDHAILVIRSVIFDTILLNPKYEFKNSNSYYFTSNTDFFIHSFAQWFFPKLQNIKTADSLGNVGKALVTTNPQAAINSLNAAVNIASGWVNCELLLNNTIGDAYFNMQQYQPALKYYYKADSLDEQYDSYRHRSLPYKGLALTYKQLGQKDSVKKYNKLAHTFKNYHND